MDTGSCALATRAPTSAKVPPLRLDAQWFIWTPQCPHALPQGATFQRNRREARVIPLPVPTPSTVFHSETP
jgi:hypothetical protein